MSEARELPGKILVAGAGLTGVLAAAALRRALPATDVTVLSTPPEPAAFADHASSALPFSSRFLETLGLAEAGIVARCGGSHRLLTRYRGFAAPDLPLAAPYGAVTDPALLTGFARDWGGGRAGADTAEAPGSLAQILAEAGRYQPGLPGVEHALRWHPGALRDFAIALAQSLGVEHRQGRIGAVRLGSEGQAEAYAIEGAGEISADLFIDCTGPAASLLAQMPMARRIDWSDHLPIRQVLTGRPEQPMLSLEDRVTLTGAGWLHELAGRDGLQRMLGVAPYADEAAILEALGGEPVGGASFVPGRADKAWIGNVIALGDAAALFDPLPGLNADFAHRQIALLLELLPGRAIIPGEREEFNRRTALMADGARDIVAAHYLAPESDERFGKVAVSEELALSIDQYTRRGRTPFFEEAPLSEAERGGLYSALGLERGHGSLPSEDGDTAARQFAAQARALLDKAPPYQKWMASVLDRSREATRG